MLEIISVIIGVMGLFYAWYTSNKYKPVFYQIWGLFLSLSANQMKYSTACQNLKDDSDKRLYDRLHDSYYMLQGLLTQAHAIGLAIDKNKWEKMLKQEHKSNRDYQEWLQKMSVIDKINAQAKLEENND